MRLLALLIGCSFVGVFLTLALNIAAAENAPSGKQRIYIGGYTSPNSRGIYRCELDLATGKLTDPVLATEAANASFLAIHPNRKFLYAVSEVAMLDGKKTGGVAAFAIDPASGDLKPLNLKPCGGAGPCHLVVDRPGNHVLVANYSGGSAAVLPIASNGELEDISGFAQHVPTGGKTGHPKAPHAHSINLDAAGRFAIVCDAGIDTVFIYRYDAEKGTLTPNIPPVALADVDAAPRHFAFHPNGRQAYAINEAAMSVTAYNFDAKTGALTSVQTISTLPEGTEIKGKGYSTAEVVVHPSGKFLYGSNRGYDTIAAFKIDPDNGQLTSVGQFARGAIKVPRNFNVDPTGTYALVAGQDSNNVVVFRINQQTGALEPTGSSIEVGKPVCVKFFPL